MGGQCRRWLAVEHVALPSPKSDTLTKMDQRLEYFLVDGAYRVLDFIGEGTYGIIWSVLPVRKIPDRSSAVHQQSQRKVAIKRITPFDHSMFCLRTFREIKLLRHFRHENIISVLDILQPPSFELFRDVYLG